MSVAFQNEKFNSYFAQIYGERWPSIAQALIANETQVLRKNLFANYDVDVQFKNVFETCYQVQPQVNVHNLQDEQGVQVFYKMDPASYFVAKALGVQPHDQVLDICAAPGGKSLILAESLNGTGQLTANEYSQARRERLVKVIREYIPHEFRQNIFVTGKDGNAFGLQQPNTYDRVLADVPCSGERHLIENSKEFLLWTKRRSENLAIRQYSLLSSAYLACKPNGCIVYSTCSISPLENDEVIRKLNKKKSIKLIQPNWVNDFDFIEKTEFGYQILPDRIGIGSGFGPMYFAVFSKVVDSSDIDRADNR